MRKLNSIHYGGRLLGGAMVLCLILPGGFRLAERLDGRPFWGLAAGASAGLGAGLALFLAGLLAVEFYQDRKLLQDWDSRRWEKRRLENGGYECPCCGNREIRAEERECLICGNRFETERTEKGDI